MYAHQQAYFSRSFLPALASNLDLNASPQKRQDGAGHGMVTGNVNAESWVGSVLRGWAGVPQDRGLGDYCVVLLTRW